MMFTEEDHTMELRELRSFSTAAKLRSISKAAEQLGIGQPTVTMHVKKLEEEMGGPLFDRVKRPIQLTLTGAKLAELATPLLDGIDSLVARTYEAESEGPVRVGSTYDMVPHTLLAVVKAFIALYPHVHLEIRSETAREVLRMVEDGEVDLGIVPGLERRAGLDFQGLFVYERVLITPLGNPLLQSPLRSLDQIAEWPLILRRRGTHTRTMLEEEFRRRGLSYEIIVELDSMDMIKRYVALGLGISVGPELAIDPEDRDELGIIPMTTLLPVEQAGIVTARGKTLSTPLQNFITVMNDTISPAGRS